MPTDTVLVNAEDAATPGPTWHELSLAAVQARVGARPEGLPQDEAAARLLRHGPNTLLEVRAPSNLRLLLHQLQSPLIYILLLAAVVTVALREFVDAIVISLVLLLHTSIGFVQERQAERSVHALLQLAGPRARVVRSGREWEVASRELVPGDLILLESGARVPADVRLVTTAALVVDESLLTGESIPTAKRTGRLEARTALAERTNMAYAGTTVTSGRGRGYVVATGDQTEIGRIAAEVRETPRAETPLEQQAARFARIVGVATAVAALLALAIGLARGESPTDMFLVAVALAVAAVPEGLPVAYTITLALGTRRMARHNAIIRRLSAVETLGGISTIGSDKTGTLTENRMTVRRIWAGGEVFTLPGPGSAEPATAAEQPALRATLLTGILTNEATIYLSEETGEYESTGDPTEAALLVAAARLGLEPEEVRLAHPLELEIPFEAERQYSAAVRRSPRGMKLYVKGAPERILAMCTTALGPEGIRPLDAAVVARAAQHLARQGLRLLAMAGRDLPNWPLPGEVLGEPGHLTFFGLQGMLDPPRAGARAAVEGCQRAGIRVVMITGDHAETARMIAADLGIAGPETPILTGADISRLDPAGLRERVPGVAVYARVEPSQKLAVVRALQSHGEVVAVTGDGVNDAPALRAADVGVAMGKRGTDVARQAADVVLADDNFVSIYDAVKQGRIAFDNLRKVTFFLIATNAAELLALLAALAAGWPMPLLPTQILWLNLMTEGVQDVALAFEPGEADVPERRPRPRHEGILSRLLWQRTLLVGAVVAAGTLAIFHRELQLTGSLARAQTVALTTMVLFEAFQLANVRSERTSVFRTRLLSNPLLVIAALGALAVHVLALYFPPTQFLLGVEPLEPAVWLEIVAVAASIIVVMELDKLVRRRRAARRVRS